jgi:hypothetical protein
MLNRLNLLSIALLCILMFFLSGCKNNGQEEAIADINQPLEGATGPDIESLVRQGPSDQLPGSLKFASVAFPETGDDFVNDQQSSQESDQRQDGSTREDVTGAKTPEQTSQNNQTSSPDPAPTTPEPQEEEQKPAPTEEPAEVEPPKPGTMEYILWQQGKGQQQQGSQTTTETTTIIVQDPETGMTYQQQTTTQTVD